MIDQVERLRRAERERMQDEVAIELQWWGNSFIVDSIAAKTSGLLVEVPTEGNGYRLIGVLRREIEPRLLNYQALMFLNSLSGSWRDVINNWSLPSENTYFSITSLYRDSGLQGSFVEKGMNAAVLSAHQAGAAIDIDPEGYFYGPEKKAMNPKNEGYERKYMDALLYVIADAQRKGVCHFIVERGYDVEGEQVKQRVSCYHVCVSPDYLEYE